MKNLSKMHSQLLFKKEKPVIDLIFQIVAERLRNKLSILIKFKSFIKQVYQRKRTQKFSKKNKISKRSTSHQN